MELVSDAVNDHSAEPSASLYPEPATFEFAVTPDDPANRAERSSAEDAVSHSTDFAVSAAPTPPRRKRGLLVGVGVLATLVVAGGAFAVMRRGDSGYSLQKAAAAATAATFTEVDGSISVGELGAYEMVGAFDSANKTFEMTLTPTQPGPVDTGVMEIKMNSETLVMYMKSAMFSEMPGFDKEWIKMDLQELSEQMGIDLDDLMSQAGGADNPLSVAPLFSTATNVVDLGSEDLGDEAVKHYEVTLDADEVFKATPQIAKQLESLDVDVPDELVYDVWVTKDDELRRFAFDLDLAGQSVAYDMKLNIGEARPIVMPTDDEAADFADMMGLGG